MFFIARICREYSMDYFAVLALPLRTFWALNRQVDCLRAENEMRTFRMMLVAQNPEGKSIAELSDSLRQEMGTPTRVERGFDEAKFDELQARFQREK